MTTAELITAECNAIKAILLDKNARYGDSAMQPRRIFSKADHLEQLKVRIDDKLSRIATMGPDGEDEDTTADLIGYLVLLRIAQRRASHGEVVDDEFDPWQSAVPEQDVQRRERVAHGAGYIIPQMEDGDDDPAVHVVLDRTSREGVCAMSAMVKAAEADLDARMSRYRTSRNATLPDECLVALCGRVRG